MCIYMYATRKKVSCNINCIPKVKSFFFVEVIQNSSVIGFFIVRKKAAAGGGAGGGGQKKEEKKRARAHIHESWSLRNPWNPWRSFFFFSLSFAWLQNKI